MPLEESLGQLISTEYHSRRVVHGRIPRYAVAVMNQQWRSERFFSADAPCCLT